ncbi:FAD-binding oxidoreductase [Agromyces ramosus]|uniref:FAD/FMN-containing dehydrogenase n=1 Tax=Agromyces ramosus TaxID=33879 RepID=A0ABU0R5W6_9MICO|nr:FAD-binding oxidoreductase [Agromyces ramosus]MDQ0893481.1 FAD/FMN-containing dehydrogenase [Agromyces ramosus]
MQNSAPRASATLEIGPAFQGQQFSPGDDGYDAARAVYNGMVDKRPALIARCTGTADVVDAVALAREGKLPLAVRCGGHSVAGNGVSDGGVLIDLSGMKGVHVDPDARVARANGGVLWGEFDRETQLFGLATPGGRVTTTGVGGFTLGGGYGWLSTKWGLACDNLISAQVVTADGRVVTASADENADLLWGLRGGGGNFGVVTSYEFQLHELDPTVMAGLVVHPLDDAVEIGRAWRDWVEAAPPEVGSSLVVFIAPPEPFIPAELQGKPALMILAMFAGDADEGEAVLRPLKEQIGPPAVDAIDRMPYTAFQTIVDGFSPKGWLNYHRGEHLVALSDDAIAAHVEHGRRVKSPMSYSVVFHHGGAISAVDEEATASSDRDAPYMWHPIAAWTDPADSEREINWVRESSAAMAPFTTGGVYLNFEPDVGEAQVRAGFSAESYDRLVALKDRWDPENLFHINPNIPPSRQPANT